jgi:hypothetical protein
VANMSQWNSRPSAKSPATINHWLSEQGIGHGCR